MCEEEQQQEEEEVEEEVSGLAVWPQGVGRDEWEKERGCEETHGGVNSRRLSHKSSAGLWFPGCWGRRCQGTARKEEVAI